MSNFRVRRSRVKVTVVSNMPQSALYGLVVVTCWWRHNSRWTCDHHLVFHMNCDNVDGVSGVDERGRWWSAVLSVAVHWSTLADTDTDTDFDDLATLHHLYAVVDNIPRLSHGSE